MTALKKPALKFGLTKPVLDSEQVDPRSVIPTVKVTS